MSKSRKKRLTPIHAGALIGGAVGGFLVGMLIDLPDVKLLDLLPFMLLALVMLLAAFLLQIILHEAGHLVFGLLTGYRFVSFNVFGLQLQRMPDGRIRFTRRPMAGMGGQCLMAPPGGIDEAFPHTLYNMGGILMNGVTAFACLLPALLADVPGMWQIFLLMLGGFGLLSALENGIPLPNRIVQNDGRNQLCMRTPLARRALWVQLSVAAAMADGKRLRDMPAEWFAAPPEEEMDNPLISAITVFAANRLMDQCNLSAAEEAIQPLLAREKGILGLHRMLLTCDGAVCELLAGRPADLTEALGTQANQQMMQAMKTNPSILRTRYAAALLKERNMPAANQLLEEFHKRAPAHPFPQEIESEKELLRLIQDAYHKEFAYEDHPQ